MKIYYESPETARAAGNLEEYRQSTEENRRTRKAIDDAIKAHFDGMHLSTDALRDVLSTCDPERVALVLATSILDRADWDARISGNNIKWAHDVRIPDGAPEASYASWFICHSHPAILDGFVTMFRRDAHKYTRPEPAAAEPDQRKNAGYRIIAAVPRSETAEVVIGENKNAPSPYVVWDCYNGNDYNTGRYCNSYRQAVRTMGDLLTSYADAGWIAVNL